jgi:aspartyl-tRNA(Asn)/glutamyl-tRNA(Gln) amidotransferase subunit C
MKEKISNIADLAALKLSDEEAEVTSVQFNKILDYVSKIELLDLEGVEPLTHVNEAHNVWREDEAGDSLSLEEALKNAPKRNEQFFKAPKVIE